MAEKQRRARPLHGTHRIISVVGDHRSNNVVYGHVGRLTYVSPEDAGEQDGGHAMQRSIGKLYVNRMTESNYSFQEWSQFKTWYPATKLAAVRDGQAAERHLAWLYHNAPSALVGAIGPWDGLTKEIEAVTSVKLFEARQPLLAYGEIANRTSRTTCIQSAVATAVGSLGNILRIARIQDQELRWAWSRGASIKLASADATDEGHWCSTVPISQIKFTAPSGAATPLRWVLVQTGIATVMFEPVIQRGPVQAGHAACSYVSRGPSRINVKYMMQISAEDTGGEPHSDMSFNQGSEGEAPQLAIIDKGGSWSVWDIKISPRAQKLKLRHSIRAKGVFTDGIPTALPPVGVHGRRNLHRVVWLPAADKERGPLPQAGYVQNPQQEKVRYTQAHTLLLCNDTLIKTLNVESREPLQMLSVTRQNGLDALLDIQRCPTKSSRVFVLTSTTLFWLDLALAESGTDLEFSVASLEGTAKPKSQQEQPVVLLSCPHLRDASDGTLKLCVAPSTALLGRSTSLACVYSTKHADVTVFWFVEPGSVEQASFQQQLFRFTPPTGSREQDRLGEQSMLVFPSEVPVISKAANGEDDAGRHYAAAGLRFFQFVALGPDLDLRSAICVSTPTLGRTEVRPPLIVKEHIRKQYNGRVVGGRSLGNIFVVPDDVGNISHVKQMARPRLKGLTGRTPERMVPTLNLFKVFELLDGQVEKTARAARQAASVVRGFQNPTPLDVIRGIIQIGNENGSYPYSTLLDAVEGDFVGDFGADLTDLSWAQKLEDVDLGGENRVHVFDQIEDGARCRPSGGVHTLYQAMGELCEVTDELASARRPGLVESAAVQLYFSLLSMSMDSRQMARSNGTTPMDGEGSPQSTAGSGHRATSRSRSAGEMEMSSSPPDRILWPPSSQGTADVEMRQQEEEEEEEGDGGEMEDPTIARLRQYAVSIRSEAPRTEGEIRLLSHWKLGSDPAQFWWKPTGSRGGGEEEQKRAEEEASERRRARNEKKARRERERMARLLGEGVSTPSAPRIQLSQAPELAMRSSPVRSSQVQSSQLVPTQIMSSQVFSSQAVARSSQAIPSSQSFGGLYGHRAKKNKAKRAGGFK